MKTIDQISTEVTEQIMFNERHINFVEMGKDIAKKAIIEAQRLIPLNEELPPKTIPETQYSIPVLIKDESEDYYVACYDFILEEFDIFCDVIVGWRSLSL